MSKYRDHPLLKGFKDQPDSELLEAAIGCMEYATWVAKGADPNKEGLAPGIPEAIRNGFSEVSRDGLEKLLYHAILAQVDAHRKARSGEDSTVSPTQG